MIIQNCYKRNAVTSADLSGYREFHKHQRVRKHCDDEYRQSIEDFSEICRSKYGSKGLFLVKPIKNKEDEVNEENTLQSQATIQFRGSSHTTTDHFEQKLES